MITGLGLQGYSPERLLEERFHIATGFHPGQYAIIEQLVQGKRVLAIQRTGWGKSLCYQVASLYYPHLTLIFSPLKALMRDQCQRCNSIDGMPAAIVSSDFTRAENQATLERAVVGALKLLYIAPERLDNKLWQSYVARMRISMIVIDEAHCISMWGHDFRPDYRRIIHFLNAMPQNTPMLALTATANKRVEEDILQQMGEGVQVMRGTMQRPNLYLHVVRVCGNGEKLGYIGEALSHCSGTGIIYTATRGDAEMVAAFLRSHDIVAEYYHAGREDVVRQGIEQKWMANQYKVICSTNALGMGIDKSDVRFIIHYHIPASPIHYYQEMGRAGRDGQMAHCVLLYDPEDLVIQEGFIRYGQPDSWSYGKVLAHLIAHPQGLNKKELVRLTGFPQTMVGTMLADLEEQKFAEQNPRDRSYIALARQGQVDFSHHTAMQIQKLQELKCMQEYAYCTGCYMEYLTTYLGDLPGYRCGVCGHCQPANFPVVWPSARIQDGVARFLDEELLPCIAQCGVGSDKAHEAGWSLSYHGNSHGTTATGKLVQASKYAEGGPFALSLVTRAVDVIRTRYPLAAITAIVSVPPTRSGILVEHFARQVAAALDIEYVAALAKVRPTREQKELKSAVQKQENVKGAFVVRSAEHVAGRTLLLIDDIYDSGQMLHEVGRTLMQAGARAVYPFTITRNESNLCR